MATNNRVRLQVEQLEPRELFSAGPAGRVFIGPLPLRPPGDGTSEWIDPIFFGSQIDAARITVTNLLEADGTPDNKSRLVVPFTAPVGLLDASKVTLTATALDPNVPGALKTVSIPVLQASMDPADAKNLVLTTGVLVPRGARIAVAAGALTSGGQPVAAQAAESPVGVSTVDFTMANRALAPTDIDLFTELAFPAATSLSFAPGQGPDEATARTQLNQLLGQRVNLGRIDAGERARILGLYDAASTKSIIPNPNLRAALLSLSGTSASGAIDTVLTNNNRGGQPYVSIEIDLNLTASAALHHVFPDGTQKISVSANVKAEPFQALGALLAHEVMHDDQPGRLLGQNEEVIASAALTFAWAEQLLVSPSLASRNTFRVRVNNTHLLALLNSGNNSFPRIGLTSAPQTQSGSMASPSKVFVGGWEGYRSFDHHTRAHAAFWGIPDIDTPGNAYLSDFVSKVTRSNQTGNGFNRATRDLIDRFQQAISNDQALTLATTLRLTVVTDPRIQQAAISVTHLLETDGTPDNKSRLVIPFSQALWLADATKITLTGRADDLTTNRLKDVAIPVLQASIDPANPRNLVLITGVLLPGYARIAVAAGALTDAVGQPVDPQTVASPAGMSEVDFTMANRAFRPTDINLFNRTAFPTATIAPTAPGQGPSATEARSQLDEFLGRKVNLGRITAAERSRVLGLYDAASTRAILPNPNLRAGLLSLSGTSASGAIDTILTSNNQSGRPYASVDFDPSVVGPSAVTGARANGARLIRVNLNLRGESFQALGALLAHEAMHQDGVNGRTEEVLAGAAQAFSWAENLLVDPNLALRNTLLVRDNNTILLALLNSGNRGFPRIGLSIAPPVQTGPPAPASKVFVGGEEAVQSFDHYLRTFAALAGAPETDTVGNAYLRDFVAKVTRSSQTGDGFTLATRDLLDQHQQVLSNQQALELARILKLTFP